MFSRAQQRPGITASLLFIGSVVSVCAVLAGDAAFRQRWSLAKWIAWPGGTAVFFVPALFFWLLLLVPTRRIEGKWASRAAAVLLTGTALGIPVQLLDDHVMNHPGTQNPLGVSIPFPLQDLLTFVALVLVVLAGLLGILIALSAWLISRPPRS